MFIYWRLLYHALKKNFGEGPKKANYRRRWDKDYGVWNPFKSKLATVVLGRLTIFGWMVSAKCGKSHLPHLSGKTLGCCLALTGRRLDQHVNNDEKYLSNAKDTKSFVLRSFNSMASSSISSVQNHIFKYDVFLSFRGEDTRKTFVGHLYEALTREGIVTYKDDVDLDQGKIISKELIQAIEDSRFHVIVFSKDYASSSWCLQELTKIIECQNRTTEQTVYPIFYHVEPTEVRNQIGEFGKAFAKHEKAEAAQKWRDALVQAASFSGWHLETIANGEEVELIKIVVNKISLKLPSIGAAEDHIAQSISHHVEQIQVNLLSNEEALPLFCMNAFGIEIPVQGYEELSREVVSYAAGLPLTITVLGSHLRGRSTCRWKGLLESLKRMPNKEVVDILELSYTSLEDHIKEIFLDVACMRLHYTIFEVVLFLESCGHFQARCGLDVLKEKSLITISNDGEKVVMHDQIVEMARNIVRRPHRKEPHKRSHLWEKREIGHILANDLGTEATECILYVPMEIGSELFMKGLRKMKKLRFLSTFTASQDRHCFSGDWRFDEVTEYIPNSLQCLTWMYYPFSSLPKTFQANNLVMLLMLESEIVQLWEGGEKKILKKLKCLNLQNSQLKTLDLGMTPNLKELWLFDCRHLVELLFPLQCLELTYINLSHTKLRILELWRTPVLSELRLEGCDDLVEIHIPFKCPYLIKLYLSCCKLRTLDLQATPNLKELSLVECVNLEELHIPIKCRLNLTFLTLRCLKLRILDILGTLNLESLIIACDDLAELYIPAKWPKLKSFNLNDSKLTTLDLQGAQNLKRLDVRGCYNLQELRIYFKCLKLVSIEIIGAKLRTFDLALTLNLKRLRLTECSHLVELLFPLQCLELTDIDLSHTKLRTLDLRGAPNLESLNILCDDLTELHIPAKWPKLKSFNLGGSKLTTLDLQGAQNLQTLDVRRCYNLEDLRIHFNSLKLESIEIMGAKLRTLNLALTPNLKRLNLTKCSHLVELQAPEDLGLLECLEVQILWECTVLQDIPNSICKMKRLRYFYLADCVAVEKLPEGLGRLECLKELNIEGTNIRHLPQSIFEKKGLLIVGFRRLLESFGFTSEIQTLEEDETFCYVEL
ncbi:LOW QUALITY PROTEIN: hypothetical protein OSB04_015805 [Centaurea solstitialis]|uniref:TIR domain-containing protein n=1 Tax=Centaurea solstitialis TaxID=347529 RepID=A0AA38SZQ8_9ASTR|nr:LOW QUALITY PROTEIN: hypothetical protein OSB04_015805 [Centaurea solstitialis]